jgi:hypothetical protein
VHAASVNAKAKAIILIFFLPLETHIYPFNLEISVTHVYNSQEILFCKFLNSENDQPLAVHQRVSNVWVSGSDRDYAPAGRCNSKGGLAPFWKPPLFSQGGCPCNPRTLICYASMARSGKPLNAPCLALRGKQRHFLSEPRLSEFNGF